MAGVIDTIYLLTYPRQHKQNHRLLLYFEDTRRRA